MVVSLDAHWYSRITLRDMYRKIALLIALFLALNIQAQEQSGSYLSRYSGSHGLSLNPASSATAAQKWDVGLFNLHLYVNNDYAYLMDQSVPKLLGDLQAEADLSESIAYYGGQKMDGLLALGLKGPSFMVQLDNIAFGAYAGIRSNLSLQNVDADLGYQAYSAIPNFQNTEVDPFQISALNWMEFVVNIAPIIAESSTDRLALGINLKYLQALDGIYLNSGNLSGFTKTPGSVVELDALDMELAYTGNPGTNTEVGDLLSPKGRGFAVDLGVQYEIGGSSITDGPYLWKMGASLMDIGRVSFSEQAAVYRYNSNTISIISQSDLEDVQSMNEFQQILSSAVYDGNSDSSFAGNSFGMWMPAALSIQVDRYVGANVFVGGIAVRNLPISAPGVQRENLIGIVPRYEHQWFEAALPVLLVNDQDLRMGAAFRLGWLTIGSDDLWSLALPGNLDGTDLYVGLKINEFEFKGGRGRGKGFTCPAYQ